MARKDKKAVTDPFIKGDPQENITEISIEDVLSESFGRYSKHIILERSIPDIRDGLKPVQRRVLYSMYKDGNTSTKAYRKSARVVGNVIGTLHPHGDSSVYEAIVRMAQDWKLTIPVIDFQGNCGTIDNDPAAASRYSEVRLSRLSSYILNDLDKDTVPWVPNFSDDMMEPTVLPTAYPNILTIGVSGIAAGYATEIPPHNLNEVVNAAIYRLKNPDCSFEDIYKIVPGPDFPTGGIIQGTEQSRKALQTGKGKIVIRSKLTTREEKGMQVIEITEIPYGVIKSEMVKKIDEIRIDKKLPGMLDVRDESCNTGIKIVIELKKDAPLQSILNYLYKNTELQNSYNCNMVAIADNAPKQVGIMECLDCFIKFRKEVITRRTAYELKEKQGRLHILEGLKKALDILDEVIKTIRKSANKAQARTALMDGYGFTEKQAEAIVVMRLYKLSNTDIGELEAEYATLTSETARLQSILADPAKLNEVMVQELEAVNREFPTPRRTKIEGMAAEIVIDKEALIPNEKCMVAVTRDGYVKRVSMRSYGAANETFPGHKEDDHLVCQGEAGTRQNLIFFTNTGKYGCLPVHKIPECKWKEIGSHISASIKTDMNDRIINAYIMSGYPKEARFVSLTKNGMVKQTLASSYETIRQVKTSVDMKLAEGDKVIAVQPALYKEDSLYLITANGFGLTYPLNQVPVTSTGAKGVRGMKVQEGDSMAAMVITPVRSEILLGRYDGSFKHIDTTFFAANKRPAKGKPLFPQEETLDFAQIMEPGMEITYEAEEIKTIPFDNLPLTDSTEGFSQPHGLAEHPIEMLDHISEVTEGMQETPEIAYPEPEEIPDTEEIEIEEEEE